MESFITGIIDNWPNLRAHRNKFTIVICCLMFFLGLTMVTNVSINFLTLFSQTSLSKYKFKKYVFQGGIYIFQLMDFYSASGMSILWVCFFQTIAISWIFGAKKFCDCIHQMMEIELNKFWYICWVVLAPMTMAVSIVFIKRESFFFFLLCFSSLIESRIVYIPLRSIHNTFFFLIYIIDLTVMKVNFKHLLGTLSIQVLQLHLISEY